MEKTITTTVMLTRAQALKEDQAIKYSAEDLGTRLLKMKDLEGWRALGFDCWSDYLDSLEQHRATLYRLMNSAQTKLQDTPEPDQEADKETPEPEPEPAGTTPKTEVKPLEINKSLSQNATDLPPAEPEPEPKKPAAPSGPKAPENPKLEAALNYLEKVIGEKEIKAVRNGIIVIPDREVIIWGNMSDDDIARISELVISHRWMPSEALRFTNKAIDEKTRISDLNLLAVKQPLEVTVAGFTTLTFNRRSFADALPKILKLLGIKP